MMRRDKKPSNARSKPDTPAEGFRTPGSRPFRTFSGRRFSAPANDGARMWSDGDPPSESAVMFTTPRPLATQPPASAYTPTASAEAGWRLVHAFDTASDEGSDQSLVALRAAAIEFVGALKKQGLAPERVVVALKTALRAGDSSHWGWIPSLDVEDAWGSTRNEPTVYASLFRWCVEAYYDDHGRSSRISPDVRRRRSPLMTACPVGL